ncbi:MAG: hypothetical protein K9M45_13040 [Kiritimatiellales bacterium]|nr:hypothetical protein [Kiritimatiellales bacterium]
MANADAEKEKWRQEAASAAAERAESEDPVRRIHDLRSDIGKQLTDLAGKFESETEEYTRLKQAVEDKQTELQRIYEVETAASDLRALIEANRKCKEDFEREMAVQRQKFEAEMETNKAVSGAGELYASWGASERRTAANDTGS